MTSYSRTLKFEFERVLGHIIVILMKIYRIAPDLAPTFSQGQTLFLLMSSTFFADCGPASWVAQDIRYILSKSDKLFLIYTLISNQKTEATDSFKTRYRSAR